MAARRADGSDPPISLAWRHREAREGFEVAFVRPGTNGAFVVDGSTAGVEAGVAWIVTYAIHVDGGWVTRGAEVRSRSSAGSVERVFEADGAGGDGEPAPHLDGCLDIDLEASALTNAFPVRRLRLAVAESADAPAAYVRAPGLELERLEQRYTRLPAEGLGERYDYETPAFGFRCVLTYGADGFVVDYPGIAHRSAI